MIRIFVVLAAFATAVHAGTLVEIPKSKVRLDLPDGWQTVAAPGTVTAYKHEHGAVLAVTRADVPNTDAWLSKSKQAYADEVETGIAARLPGYKRSSKKLITANGVPALDLEARREGGATVVVRVLMFRTYALALAIEIPKGGEIKAARGIASAFMPPKD